LANLAIKEEDEDDENLLSITSQQKEVLESIENGSDAEFRPGASIVDEECRCSENFSKEQGLVEKGENLKISIYIITYNRNFS
jgi:hypothetical protein